MVGIVLHGLHTLLNLILRTSLWIVISSSLKIRPVKTTMRYCYAPITVAKVQDPESIKCWRDVGQQQLSSKVVQTLWKAVWLFLINILLAYIIQQLCSLVFTQMN